LEVKWRKLFDSALLPLEVTQCRASRIGPAHAMGARTGRRGGRADVHARNADRVRRQRGSWAEGQLANILGPGHDVTADVVRVQGRKLRGSAHCLPHDPIAEAGSEPFNLRNDRRCRIPGITVGHMGIRPDRMNVADRSLRVGQVLLTDQHERPLGHTPSIHVAFGGGQFAVIAGQVDGAGPVRFRNGPRHATLHGEVDFESAWAVLESAVGASNAGR